MSGKECLAKSLFVIYRNVTVSTTNGGIEIHNDTKVLQIIEQTVKFLPIGIEKFLPQLEALWVLYSRLSAIEESDLKPFPTLRELVLRGNSIEALSDDLFKSNSELLLVDIGDNKLKTIGEKLLFPLGKLYKLNLRQNICIDHEARTQEEMKVLFSVATSNCSVANDREDSNKTERLA